MRVEMSKRSGLLKQGLAPLLVAATCLGIGPCGPIPGGSLSGNEIDSAINDWSFANEVPRCAVEVRPSAPHSVTVNCMSWQGRLFVSCSKCAGKDWSSYALDDPVGRIQIDESVYPVVLKRIEDPAQLDAVWQARAAKLNEDQSSPRRDGWWTFELTSR